MALPHYRAAVKYSESNLKVLPLFALANALSRKGLFDEAVFYSKQAIVETEMKDPQAYYHLASTSGTSFCLETPLIVR
jgi:tetratricopeptide (TPR) repeat protein